MAAPTRSPGIDELATHGATHALAIAPTADVDPVLPGRLIHHVRLEGPPSVAQPSVVDLHRISGAHSGPGLLPAQRDRGG